MANPTYSTGTVSINDGDTTVVGTGTIWSGVNAKAGDTIVLAGLVVAVKDVTDVTHLELPVPWTGGAQTNVTYTIIQDYPARVVGVAAAEDVGTMLAALKTQGFFFFVDSTMTAPDPSYGADGQYALQPTTGEVWLKVGGIWVSQGVYGNLAATDVPWAAGTTYGPNIIVPFAGRLWRSLVGANVGNQPDVSSTQWALFLSGGDSVWIAYDDSDRPALAEVVLKIVAPKAMTFFAAMSDSFGNATVAATASAVYSIKKNGTQFATATFAAAGTVATFACAADAVFAAGDILTMVAPSPRDATLSGIGITLTAYR